MSLQAAAVPCPVLGLNLVAQGRNRQVHSVGQLPVRVAGHHARMQRQLEQPPVRIGNSANVSQSTL